MARHNGLPAKDLVVLSERGNMVVAIGASGYVARAAYLTAFTRDDSTAWLQREVDIATAMSKKAASVATPAAGLPSGPFVIDDVPITLWEAITPVETVPDEHTVAGMLTHFHRTGTEISVTLPWLSPVTEQIPQTLKALASVNGLEPRIFRLLWKRYEAVLDGLANPESFTNHVLHGDAHPGNILRSRRGHLVWSDLEDTCVGPIEWDLACLWRTSRLDGPKAIAEYARLRGMDTITLEELSPFLAARDLQAAVWLLGLAHQQPERYRDVAQSHLNRLLDPAQGDQRREN
jgi:hypothetical protein